MKTTAVALQWVVRLLGLVQLALGFMFWTGRNIERIPTHMMIGEITVFAFWILMWVSGRLGIPSRTVISGLLYGLAMVLFARYMGNILPGGAHEAVRILHFLMGLGLIGYAESVGAKIKRAQAA
jgi:hypothetical protein